MRAWEAVISEEERLVYQQAGYGTQPVHLGKKPALLIIDVTQSFTGGASPEQGEAYATGCQGAWEAVAAIKQLLSICRSRGITIVYTTGNRQQEKYFGGATMRPRSQSDLNPEGGLIPPCIMAREDELVLKKNKASAFFDTPLATYFHRLGIDSIFVAGAATSGCVRASVVDAFSHGFQPLVVEEAAFDRSRTLHLANLFDMNAKYAHVITLEQAAALILAWDKSGEVGRGGK